VTLALGTTAAELSRTVPVRVAVVAWLKAGEPESRNTIAVSAKYSADLYLIINMDSSLIQTELTCKVLRKTIRDPVRGQGHRSALAMYAASILHVSVLEIECLHEFARSHRNPVICFSEV
jgi:hypothetical protein